MLPEAWRVERLAASRTVSVPIVDMDSGQPIPGAVVLLDAKYRDDRRGVMGYRRGSQRCYRVRTDVDGIASIPLEYFLLRDLLYDQLFLCPRNMRIVDLPIRLKAVALHNDFRTGQVEITRDELLDNMGQIPKIALAHKDSLSRLGKCFHRNIRQEPGAVTFYYRIGADSMLECPAEATADFAVQYDKIPLRPGQWKPYERIATGDGATEKVRSSIDSFGKGGVAIEPNIDPQLADWRKFRLLKTTEDLVFQKRFALKEPQQKEQEHTPVLIVRSRGGRRTAAVMVRQRSIEWCIPNEDGVFRYGKPYAYDPSAAKGKYIYTSPTRDYDPNVEPDCGPWPELE